MRSAAFHLLLVVLAGCEPSVVHVTHSTPPIAPTEAATIVFVRPTSTCDNGDHARIVDDTGRFVGALPPNTTFAVRVEPMWYAGSTPRGTVFYVWPDVLVARKPGLIEQGPVDFIRVRPSVRGPTYIGVLQTESWHCRDDVGFHFVNSTPNRATEWLRDARPFNLDSGDGHALLDRDGDATREYLKMAREKRASAERAQRVFDTSGDIPF